MLHDLQLPKTLTRKYLKNDLVFSGDKAPGLGTRLDRWLASLLRHYVTWLNFGSASARAAQPAQARRSPSSSFSSAVLSPVPGSHFHWTLTPYVVGVSSKMWKVYITIREGTVLGTQGLKRRRSQLSWFTLQCHPLAFDRRRAVVSLSVIQYSFTAYPSHMTLYLRQRPHSGPIASHLILRC